MTKLWTQMIAAAVVAWAAAPVAAETLELASPDGKITVTVRDDGGQATYAVAYEGKQVIAPSKLGMLFAEHHGFERGLAIAGSARASKDETWEQPWGERRLVRDQHNELAVTFKPADGPDRQMTVRFRAFDTGIGFRYELPEQAALAGDVNITEELTQFGVGEQTTMWYTPSDEFNRYEYITRTAPAGKVDDAHTPASFRNADGIYFSIHEAALVDYSAMSLDQLRPGNFESKLRSWSGGPKVKTRAPFTSPWRTIQVAPNAVGLISLNKKWYETDSYKDVREIDILQDKKGEDPTRRVHKNDLMRLVTKGLNRNERLIIILYYYEELTMKEIGATLDLSESRVSQMHSSIVQRLQTQLGPRRPEFAPTGT